MKNCPCCGSNRIKEYVVNGVWALVCYACGFDSAAKEKHHNTHAREREREEKAKGKPK